MPNFSRTELRILLITGSSVFAAGLAMAWIGSHYLAKDLGVPEYLISLRNGGITLCCLALLWMALAGFRTSQHP